MVTRAILTVSVRAPGARWVTVEFGLVTIAGCRIYGPPPFETVETALFTHSLNLIGSGLSEIKLGVHLE
jgi:phenylalanine-4-hydroxylase